MTPEEAQGLLDGATPGPWQVRGDGPANRQLHVCDCEERAEVAESVTWENAPLIAAAPALAELVASLRYEYAVQVLLGDGAGGYTWHFADEDSLPFGSLKPHEVRWYTKKEVQEILDAEVECFGPKGIRIGRRLVAAPEVVE